MSVLLDTNVCIDLLRGRRLPDTSDCVLSAVVVAELWVAAEKAADPAP
jgi:predicted nucleic acid-binding protein